MTQCTQLWVDRSDIRKTQKVTNDTPALAEGEILVSIDKFGLTANNVSYAVTGDSVGYWGFFPAEGNWGIVPVWGCANVLESRCNEIPVGERLYGYFPMASHAVLQPGKIRDDQFMDMAEHRQALPALYNGYRRTEAEPELLQALENERCLLFPLFMTSYVLYDRLVDNDFFGAKQVIIGSVSSKTGFGLAQILHDDPNISQRIVGLTSASNLDFVKKLGCCDEIVVYGNEENIDASLPSAYVDMSGDLRLTTALHNHLGDNMVDSCMVGATHWEHGGKRGTLPGAKPKFFFAPAQIAKRDEEWGPGVVMTKAMEASAKVAQQVQAGMTIEWTKNIDALAELWVAMLDNKVAPTHGQMVCLL